MIAGGVGQSRHRSIDETVDRIADRPAHGVGRHAVRDVPAEEAARCSYYRPGSCRSRQAPEAKALDRGATLALLDQVTGTYRPAILLAVAC